MPVYAGPLWRDGEAEEGWVRVERGRVTDEGRGRPAKALPAVLLDGVYDYHTHIGDALLHGRRLPKSLDRLVRPPHGLKHRVLSKAKPSQLVTGMRRALREYAHAGTAAVLDFREQGTAGIRMAVEAAESLGDSAPALHLLGRPTGTSDDEVDQVLGVAHGIGLSALRDLDADFCDRVARACKRARRPLALHASEGRREPMAAILALHPDLLVHVVKATSSDLRLVRDADVPIALCPSSNAFFRLRCPLRAVHKAGLRFHFGTDNAMFGNRDLLHEAARAHALAPEVPDAALLAALTLSVGKGLKHGAPLASGARSGPRRVLVLETRAGRVRWGRPATVVAR